MANPMRRTRGFRRPFRLGSEPSRTSSTRSESARSPRRPPSSACCKMVPDRIIPGTLNVGHTLPTVVQAFIFTADHPGRCADAVLDDCGRRPWRLARCGSGRGVVEAESADRHGRRSARGRDVHADAPARACFRPAARRSAYVASSWWSRSAGNFLLGALMTLGIGLYAPCMILVSLLGMSERTAFPIMMGSCAFLMPVGSLRFIREQALQPSQRPRPCDRRRRRCLCGSEVLRVIEHSHRPVARDRSRAVHGHHDATRGLERRKAAPASGARRKV